MTTVEDSLDLVLRALDGLADLHADGRLAGIIRTADVAALRLVVTQPADELTTADLVYAAPERCGALSSGLDARADLYSIGVVLYELLASRPPFEAPDAAGIVHAHLTKRPPPLDAGVPAGIEGIVGRLLAKDPDQRYQSVDGLSADLTLVAAALKEGTSLEGFEPGRFDRPGPLRRPTRLYGANDITASLDAVSQRVRTGGPSEVVVIAGPSGSGKTAITSAFASDVLSTGGLAISAKADPDTAGVPYGPIVKCLDSLVQWCLGLPGDELGRVRRALAELGDPLGSALCDLVPTANMLFEPSRAAPPPADPAAAVQVSVGAFVNAAAEIARPMTLILDDVQWSDAASLDLIRTLVVNSPPGFLTVVLTQRLEQEAGATATPELDEWLGAVAGDVPVEQIRTKPLGRDAASALITDILGGTEVPSGLVTHVVEAAQGNPFDIWQYLLSLHDAGVLTAAGASGRTWRWDKDAAAAYGLRHESIEAHVGAYAAPTRRLLGVAALSGNTVDLEIVAAAAGTTPARARHLLTPARRDGLLVESRSGLRFSHDSVRQAAARLLDAPQRAAAHIRLASAIEAAADGDADVRVFEIVTQINEAQHLIIEQDTAQAVSSCRLQLQAAQMARRSGAHQSALGYARSGRGMLPGDAWDVEPELAFELAIVHANAAAITGHTDEAAAALADLEGHVRTQIDLWRARAARLQVSISKTRFEDVLEIVGEALAACGVEVSIPPSPQETSAMLARATAAVESAGWEKIGDSVCDPEAAARGEVLLAALPLSYAISPDLHTVIGAAATLDAAGHGVSPASAAGMAAVAAMLVRSEPEGARRLGDLAVELAERFGGEPFVRFLVARFVTYLSEGVPETLRRLRHASAAAVQTADANTRHFARHDISTLHLLSDETLPHVHTEAAENMELWTGANVPALQWVAGSHVAWIRALEARTDPGETLGALAAFDTDWIPPVYRFYLAARIAVAAYLLDELTTARDAAARARSLEPFGMMEPIHTEFVFVDALLLAREAEDAGGAARDTLVARLLEAADELRALREGCVDGFVVEHEAVLAEAARLAGDHAGAAAHFDAALDAAVGAGALLHRVVVLRLMTRWMDLRGRRANAQIYADAADAVTAVWKGRGHEGEPSGLDAATLVETVRALSASLSVAEVAREAAGVLLRRLGADRVVVATTRDSELQLAAHAYVDGDEVVVTARQSTDVPWAAMRRALRSGEAVHADAPEPARAIPLVRGSRRVGVLCVCHRTFPDTFASGLDSALDVVAAQIAVSLDNARLVDDLAQAEARFRRVFSEAPLGIAAVSTSDGRIVAANPALADMLGTSNDSLAGQSVAGFVHIDDYQTLGAVMASREASHELQLISAPGVRLQAQVHSASAQMDGQPVVILLVQDVTDLRRAEAEIAHRTRHDALTGLLNRNGLEEAIEAAMSPADAAGTGVALVLVGVDRFRVLNESLGHTAGDAVLTTLSERLLAESLPGEVLARLESDVFAVLSSVSDGDELYERARKVLGTTFAAPVELPPGERMTDLAETFVTGSAGYALADSGDSPGDLLRHADAALHQAKLEGRGTVSGFHETMRRSTRERLALEQSLFRALDRGELFVRWQPQVSLSSGRVTACEALLGWHRSDGTELAAGVFVPTAEDLGLISAFGYWILDEALAQLRRWDRIGVGIQVGVNLSARQLRDPDLVPRVQQALADTDPARVVLEVTETVVAVDAVENIEVLRRLHDLGIRIAIDDFGTGYSSLSYLRHLPVDVLKIDRSFVTPLGTSDSTAETLVSTTITLSHALGLEVVAEGVETEIQRDILTRLGCDTAQGYLYARPSRANVLAAYLAAHA